MLISNGLEEALTTNARPVCSSLSVEGPKLVGLVFRAVEGYRSAAHRRAASSMSVPLAPRLLGAPSLRPGHDISQG
jgi:hypothetical protein